MKYWVVLEKTPSNYSAYLPDVPGCVATGRTKSLCLARIRSALALHLAGLEEDGIKLPASNADAVRVTVGSPS